MNIDIHALLEKKSHYKKDVTTKIRIKVHGSIQQFRHPTFI